MHGHIKAHIILINYRFLNHGSSMRTNTLCAMLSGYDEAKAKSFNTFIISIHMQMPRYISLELKSPIYNQHQRNNNFFREDSKNHKIINTIPRSQKIYKHTYMISFA
jgi:hypothetical protein